MKKLLVVVDYQNDFVNGSLGFKDAELIDGFIAAKVEAYRADACTCGNGGSHKGVREQIH